MKRLIAILMATVVLAACSEAYSDERRAELANATGYVASAIAGDVRYGGAPEDADSEVLMARLRQANAGLLEPLQGFTLKARRDGTRSSVLLCDPAGETALLEDAGCTKAPDAQYWDQGPPCTFRLDLETVCAR